MNHGKRILAALLPALVALTACASSPKPPPPKQQTIIRMAGYDQDPLMKELIQAYQTKHPDVQFDMLSLGQFSYSELQTAITDAKVDLLPGFAVADLADLSLLQPLDRFVQMDSFDFTPLGGLESLQYNGRLYAMPWQLSPLVLMYNRDLIDQAKVTFPDRPITWEQFRDLARQLTHGEGNEKIWGFHDPVIVYSLEVFIRSNAATADWWSDQEAVRKGYQTFAEMILQDQSSPKAPPIDANGRPTTAPDQGFAAGKAALTIGALYSLAALDSATPPRGVTFLPVPAGKPPLGLARPQSISVGANAQNLDAAWAFVRFLVGPEAAAIIANHGIIPAYRTPDIAELWLRSRPGTPEALKSLATMDLKLLRDNDPSVPNRLNEWIRICGYDAFTGAVSWQDAFARYTTRAPAK